MMAERLNSSALSYVYFFPNTLVVWVETLRNCEIFITCTCLLRYLHEELIIWLPVLSFGPYGSASWISVSAYLNYSIGVFQGKRGGVAYSEPCHHMIKYWISIETLDIQTKMDPRFSDPFLVIIWLQGFSWPIGFDFIWESLMSK